MSFRSDQRPVQAAAITPHDSNNLTQPEWIYVGVTGNVKIITEGGSTVTYTAVPAGDTLPIKVTRVFSTGTSATTMIGSW